MGTHLMLETVDTSSVWRYKAISSGTEKRSGSFRRMIEVSLRERGNSGID